MGRPKKTSAQTRPHVVSFRLNAEEMAQLRKEAEEAGLEPGERARMKAVRVRGVAGGPATRRPSSPEAFELRQELRRIGVNMNQIARRLNMTGEHEPEELREASKHLDEVFLRMLQGRMIN